MEYTQKNIDSNFLDLLPEIIFEVDTNLNINFLNKACTRILGYNIEDIVNKKLNLEDIFLPSEIKRLKESISKNFNGTHISGNSYSIYDKNRNEKILTFHNSHILNGGKVVGLRCIAIDNTNKEKDLKRLSSKEKHYRQIYQNSPIAYQSLDPDGNFIDINPMWVKIIGYNRNEILGKNFKFILTEEYSKKFSKAFKIFKAKGEISNIQFNIITKDKRIIFVQFNGKIEYDSNGNVFRTHCVLNDITLQKKAEQTLIDSEIKLRELNATKDKFFSIIAHDLKNPFNDLIGFTQLLSLNIDNYDKSKIEKFTDIIHQSSKLAYNLLENLLDWSRAQTGSLKFKPEKILLNNIIDENIDLLDSTAKNKNIKIYSEVESDIHAFADKNMIKTVVRNLISNAIKYTNQGGYIKVSNFCTKDTCEISIIDNGIGISEENINKLFKIDETYSTPGTEREKGTGLGLILCKEFIQRNNGTLRVISDPAKGSNFTFTIPLAEKEY